MELIGVIKNVTREKGFGFITPEDKRLGKDVFFHRSAVPADLWDALEPHVTKVACTVEAAPKGLRATSVRAIEAGNDLPWTR